METPDLGNEDGVTATRQGYGKPTARRYSPEEKADAVRMVRTLRAEIGTEYGTVQRVATQLGYGVESVRMWVKQADIDEGVSPGVSTTEVARLKELEQEVRELRRANEMAKSSFSSIVDGGICISAHGAAARTAIYSTKVANSRCLNFFLGKERAGACPIWLS